MSGERAREEGEEGEVGKEEFKCERESHYTSNKQAFSGN